MAHFSELDEQNIIIRTIVVSNDDILDESGNESESLGISLAQRITGSTNRWIQVSYNGSFRRQYPKHDGFFYRDDLDAVIEPSPFPSWVLDDSGYWQAPLAKPQAVEGFYSVWNEEQGEWVNVLIPDLPEIPATPEVPIIGE